MRRAVVIGSLLALLLPVMAWGSGIDLTNQFGTVNIGTGGIVSSRSELMSFGNVSAATGNLGWVYFSTGVFQGTNFWSGGTFSDVGSSFIVTSPLGIPGGGPTGTLFSGAFINPIQWTLVSHNGTNSYVFNLSGTIGGDNWNGTYVTGTTSQTINISKNQWYQVDSGSTTIKNPAHIPEPGTLGLLGTGLVSIAGILRRKLMRI